MKVTLITGRLTHNGQSTSTLNLARGLSQSGWEVRVCIPGGDLRSLLRDRDIESYLVKYNLFSFRTSAAFAADFTPEVLRVTSERALRAGSRLANRLGRKYVLLVHDLLEEQAPRLSPAQAIAGGNETLREVLVHCDGVPKARIRLIPKGVDLALFEIPAISLDGRLPPIGSIGRFVPGKGQEVFIRTARQVPEQGSEVLFLLIGQGSEERRLRQLIGELEPAQAVTISPLVPIPHKSTGLLTEWSYRPRAPQAPLPHFRPWPHDGLRSQAAWATYSTRCGMRKAAWLLTRGTLRAWLELFCAWQVTELCQRMRETRPRVSQQEVSPQWNDQRPSRPVPGSCRVTVSTVVKHPFGGAHGPSMQLCRGHTGSTWFDTPAAQGAFARHRQVPGPACVGAAQGPH